MHITADQAHLIISMTFSKGSVFFLQDHTVQEWFEETAQGVNLASEFPRSGVDQAFVESAGQTSPTHRGPTSQLKGLKGSAAIVLVPDTTALLQRSFGVHKTPEYRALLLLI